MTLLVPYSYLYGSMPHPERASTGAAAFDLCSEENTILFKGLPKLVKTGLTVAIPEGHVGLVCSRSGLALNHSVVVLNAPGLIDPDYRGEIGVVLMNFDIAKDYTILKRDRIAQLLIIPTSNAFLLATYRLPKTERGDGGFGSTGT